MAEAAEAKTSSNFGSDSKYNNNNNSNGSKSQEYDVTNDQEKISNGREYRSKNNQHF